MCGETRIHPHRHGYMPAGMGQCNSASGGSLSAWIDEQSMRAKGNGRRLHLTPWCWGFDIKREKACSQCACE
jgi:hypothetical protein